MSGLYISPSQTFSFAYPDDWKLERKTGGIVVLRKRGGRFKKDSLYELSIKPLVYDKIISSEVCRSYVKFRRKDHPGLEFSENSSPYAMNFSILKYRQEGFLDTPERTFPVVQDCWELLVHNRIFFCVFSAIKGEENSPQALEERSAAESILRSIRLL